LFRPGILIGRQGKQFDEFKAYLSRITEHNVSIKILEPQFLRFEKEAHV
jgi:ribosomal protein S3